MHNGLEVFLERPGWGFQITERVAVEHNRLLWPQWKHTRATVSLTNLSIDSSIQRSARRRYMGTLVMKKNSDSWTGGVHDMDRLTSM